MTVATDNRSMPWAVTLSWLENAYSCPLFSAGDVDW